MSVEDQLPPEGAEAESGSGIAGEIVDEAVATESITEPEYDFLEVDDDMASKYVKIKVDGEEVPVSLSEALQGYSRTQDYTRKTQELSEQRRQADQALRLQQAFATNPGMTVRILAEQAGLPVEEFLGLTPAQQQQALAEEIEYDDPLEKALAEERQARLALEARIEQRESDERLQRATDGLKQQFNATDDQVRAVVMQAYNQGLDISTFPMIFQAMAYQASQQVTAQQTAAQQAEEQRRRQAAAAASEVVSSGSGAAGTTTQQPAGNYSSIREAALAAMTELGVE